MIIGADFLKFFGFVVDFYNGQLTYHPGTPHQYHTPFNGYHQLSWDKGEVLYTALYAAATKKLEKGEKFTWTAELQKAFNDSKQHQSLTTSLKTEKPFQRTVHNMLLEVASYSTNIRYKPGKANNVAEALS